MTAGGKSALWKIAVVVMLAVALLTALVIFVGSKTMTERGQWTRTGRTILVAGNVARIETSLDPYMVSLNRNPELNRYSVRLALGDTFVPLASSLPSSDLNFGVELIGDDNQQVWFFVKEIGAWDYRNHKLITAIDLRAANPELPLYGRHDNSNNPLISKAARTTLDPPKDLWFGERRLYAFSDRLVVTSPDFAQTFSVDPRTLAAKREAGQ